MRGQPKEAPPQLRQAQGNRAKRDLLSPARLGSEPSSVWDGSVRAFAQAWRARGRPMMAW
jgi:hypothetical protein